MQKIFLLGICCAVVSGLKLEADITVSPIEKIIQLIGDLEAKLIKDGEAQQMIYEEFTDWCKGTAQETQFGIKTASSDKDRAGAAAEESAAEVSELETKIGELSTSIATNEKDLKAATAIRKTEKADFDLADQELSETVSMLRRAISIIEKEMNGGSFIQTDSMQKVSDALNAIITASSVDSADKAHIAALLQSTTDADDTQPAGAPDGAVSENQSGGIVAAMEDMLEKSEAQASEGQKNEMNAAHNFGMLKQSLETAIKTENKELSDAKKAKAAAEEVNAGAAGDVERLSGEIAADQKKLKDLQHECMTKAEEHEVQQKERGDELTALATAKKIINEKTGGATERTYDSFVQLTVKSRSQMKRDATKERIVTLLQGVAKETGLNELSMLSMRVRSEMLTGADPFKKVKGMIQEMMEKLLKEAQEEADKKAFCDKEMSETKAKREDKQEEVDDLNTKIDKSVAKIAKLDESIVTLQGELAKIASEQKAANEMRAQEKAAWTAAKSDFEQGMSGVQMALEVLRDYYAQKDDAAGDAALVQTDIGAEMSLAQTDTSATKASGSASGIIGMLEVAESDFSKMLSEGQAAEDQLQKEYDQFTEDNKITTAKKETEVTYAKKDRKATESYLSETKEDLGVSQQELDAILEYWEKLQPQCVAKPDPYEERVKRREKEIAGLKEAMTILENESAGGAFLAIRSE